MFIAAATDDNLGLAPDSVALYEKWAAARKSVELHMYAKGGHGFGMHQNNLPTDHWIDRFAEWLDLQGFLKVRQRLLVARLPDEHPREFPENNR